MNSIKEKVIVSENINIDYWNNFYKKVALDEESPFCSFVKNEIKEDVIIVDIGCGSGRDSYSFAKEGYQVYGIDRSTEAIKINNENAKNISNIEFVNIDIAHKFELNKFFNSLKEERNKKKILVYSRFFLHSINKETELILLNTLSGNLHAGDYLVLEFRTIEDEQNKKVYSDHYRRYIDSDKLKNELENKYKFITEYYYKGQGLSFYKNEDPHLARMLLKKK